MGCFSGKKPQVWSLVRRTILKTMAFTMATMHRHGDAFWQFLQLRRKHFVQTLGWNVPHNGVAEMDQYDTPNAWYVVVMEEGRVLGGSRCQPVAASWGPWSSMIRDAKEGRLEGIPAVCCAQVLDGGDRWEGTRLVLDESLPAADRGKVLQGVIEGLMGVLRAHGGTGMYTVSPLVLQRMVRTMGITPCQISEPFISTDGRRYAVFDIPVPQHQAAGEEMLQR
jgi:acyl homoserine lactone synthase